MEPSEVTTPTPTEIPTPTPTTPTPADIKPPAALTQEQVNTIVQTRLDAARKTWEKENTPKTDVTLEQKITELETSVAKANTAAVNAIVARAAVNAHNPEIVAKLVDLEGLTADDPAAITAKVSEFLEANTYLVKQPAAPDITPAPGSNVGGGPKLLTAEQIEAMSPDEMLNDDTLKLVIASVEALAK